MLTIQPDNRMSFTHGDTVKFGVNIKSGPKTKYECTAGDILYFSVKKEASDDTYALQVVVTDFADGNLIYASPEDTSTLLPGRYVYDIQVTLFNGEKYTVIDKTKLDVLEGVTTD